MKNLLEGRIEEDLKNAMKAGDETRTRVLRMLVSALRNKIIEKRGKGGETALTEEEAQAVCMGEAKKRREAAALFAKGNRADLAAREDEELVVIQAYLPKGLSEKEIRDSIMRIVREKGITDFGGGMKQTMQELKGKADGAVVSRILKEVISGQ